MKKIAITTIFCLFFNTFSYSNSTLKEIETLENINQNITSNNKKENTKIEKIKIEDEDVEKKDVGKESITLYGSEDGKSIIKKLKDKNIRVFDLEHKVVKDKITYYKDEKTPYTGVFTILIGDVLEYLESYKDGKLSGETVWFSKEGKKVMSEFYENGKLNGKQNSYYQNGKIKSIVSYSNDKVNGIVFYAKNGKELHKSNFVKGNGEWKFFWENEKLSEVGKYKNWQRDGIWKKYDEDGNLDSTIEYKNGTLTKQAWN